MITVEMNGGLGNQMFQYAFAYALQKKHIDQNVKLDLKYFSASNAIRNVEIGIFDIPINALSKPESVLSGLKLAFSGRFRKEYPYIIHENLDKGYREEYLNSIGYFRGYWQCEKYFRDYQSDLIQMFSFPVDEAPESVIRLSGEIRDTNSVSVHIRNTDYLSENNKRIYGGICDEAYYSKACKYMFEHADDAHFYVFSDDFSASGEIVDAIRQISGGKYTIVESEGRSNYWDMYLMSCCRHNIIANSTFSWWGAWLNQNDDSIVLCPSRWFNNHEVADQICDDWIKVV